MILFFILLQSAQPAAGAQPAAVPPPDVQLDVRATARRVTIHNRGRTSLEIRTSLNGQEGRGNVVDVRAPELPQGQTTLENVEIRVRGEARIPAPGTATPTEEPPAPQ